MRQPKIILTILFAFTVLSSKAQIINEYLDLQIHPTIHFPYSFFSKGLTFFDPLKPPKLRNKHMFTNVNYANYWKANKGARIFCVGLIAREGPKKPEKAKKMILAELAYIEKFIADNGNDFALARNPQQVRELVKDTTKTIIILSIEGGRNLIHSQEDANFWASKGISFITLIHLKDYEFGSSAVMPGIPQHLLNLKGVFKKERKRGLTDKGRQAILWLANAGILTDITHMNDQTRKDALAYMEKIGLPPLSTHDGFKPIQNQPRGIDADDVLKIYKNHGLMSLAITMEAYKPQGIYKQVLDSLKKAHCYCEGSVDGYIFTYNAVKQHIENNLYYIFGDSTKTLAKLSPQELTDISIGFETDFNGWTSHHRPRYGKKGCYKMKDGKTYEDVDLKGLAHPGLLASNWRLIEKEGVDLAPVRRSAEKFLLMWQYVIDNKGNFH